jgi:hypothetical protein
MLRNAQAVPIVDDPRSQPAPTVAAQATSMD